MPPSPHYPVRQHPLGQPNPAAFRFSRLHGAITGISRRLIESPTPHKLLDSYRAELICLASAYLAASTAPSQHSVPSLTR